MAKYRSHLPLLRGGTFLTDGGMETTLIFKQGADLPEFASFVLLDTQQGRRQLRDYFLPFLQLARKRGLGFVLDTPTWRASLDWGAKLGYSRERLEAVNLEAVRFVEALRAEFEQPGIPMVLNGAIGPRGDGYKEGRMSAEEAKEYHSFQVDLFGRSAADMISAVTMNRAAEAIGIAQSAREHGIPCVVSFTVETDGRLIDGMPLREAIEAVDDATRAFPAYYMVNCAHPSHFESEIGAGEGWVARIGGVRANASRMSHAELDESPTLDEGDLDDLAGRYRVLRERMPALHVLGGCCGTDHRHLAAICEACLPPMAMSA